MCEKTSSRTSLPSRKMGISRNASSVDAMTLSLTECADRFLYRDGANRDGKENDDENLPAPDRR